jgi:hypothetical protein
MTTTIEKDFGKMEKMEIIEIISILIGIYEVLSRSIPSSRTWSIIGVILRALHSVSEKLDRKKLRRQ